jgi:hypothetical protein
MQNKFFFVINPPFSEIEEEMDSIWLLDRSRAAGSPTGAPHGVAVYM